MNIDIKELGLNLMVVILGVALYHLISPMITSSIVSTPSIPAPASVEPAV